jgi:hypothetical protein
MKKSVNKLTVQRQTIANLSQVKGGITPRGPVKTIFDQQSGGYSCEGGSCETDEVSKYSCNINCEAAY